MPFRASVPLQSKDNVPNGSKTKTVVPHGKAPTRVDKKGKDNQYTLRTNLNKMSWLDDGAVNDPSGPGMEIERRYQRLGSWTPVLPTYQFNALTFSYIH